MQGDIVLRSGLELRRKALRFVERRLRLPHPLITAKFQTDGVDLFVEELGKPINASSDGQTVMADALRLSLARVEHDQDGLAARLFPFVRGDGREPKVIVVDPRLSFGKPVVAATGVPVSIIVGRYRAGEDVSTIAEDYGISVDQTDDAIRTAIPAAALAAVPKELTGRWIIWACLLDPWLLALALWPVIRLVYRRHTSDADDRSHR